MPTGCRSRVWPVVTTPGRRSGPPRVRRWPGWPIGSGWKRPERTARGGRRRGVLSGSAVSVSPAPLRVFRSSSARLCSWLRPVATTKEPTDRAEVTCPVTRSRPRSTRRGNSSMAVTMSPAGANTRTSISALAHRGLVIDRLHSGPLSQTQSRHPCVPRRSHDTASLDAVTAEHLLRCQPAGSGA